MAIFQFVREVLSVLCGFKDRRMSMAIDISVSVLRSLTSQFEVCTKNFASFYLSPCASSNYSIYSSTGLGDFRFLIAPQMTLYRKLAMSYNTAPLFFRLNLMMILKILLSLSLIALTNFDQQETCTVFNFRRS